KNKGKTLNNSNHFIKINNNEHQSYHLNLRQIRAKPNERLNTNNTGLIPKLNQSPESLLNFYQQKERVDQIINQQSNENLTKTELIEYSPTQIIEIANIKNNITQKNITSIEAYTDGSCTTTKQPEGIVGHYKKKSIIGYGIVIK